MGGTELLLLDLLPGVELLVGAEQDVLVAQLVDTDPGLGPDDGVDAPDLVCHLPRTFKTPNIIVTECVAIITKSATRSSSSSSSSSLKSSPAEIWLRVHSVKPPGRPGQLPLVAHSVHGVCYLILGCMISESEGMLFRTG